MSMLSLYKLLFMSELLIAEGLGRAFEIPVDAASLIRKKNTVPQKELDRQGRMQNMKKWKGRLPDISQFQIISVQDLLVRVYSW